MGKPSRIYVKNFIAGVSNGHFKKCQNDISGSVNITFQEVLKRHGSNTDTRRKEKVKELSGKGVPAVGAVAMVGVKAFTSEGGKQVRKHAEDIGKKAAQIAFKTK